LTPVDFHEKHILTFTGASQMTNLQFYTTAVLLSLLAAPGVAVFSFFIF
jgi:hypothetical protein